MHLPGNTPVLLGAGQVTDHHNSPDLREGSPQGLAAQAVKGALDQHGAGSTFRDLVDCIAFTRTFADSIPADFRSLFAPFGISENFPRSVAALTGLDPRDAIYTRAGGDVPQIIVADLCEQIASGELRAAIACGAEALGTSRHLQRNGGSATWSDSPTGTLNDQGPQIDDMFIPELGKHGALEPIHIYPLFENARRTRLGLDRTAYRETMGSLFERFASVARQNSLSMFSQFATASDIVTETPANRLMAEPYLKSMVAKDGVNQAAALLITRLDIARELGLEHQCVYLHGHAAAAEADLLERRDLGAAPAMAQAYAAALNAGGLSVSQVDRFDLYSCFPIAVFAALEALGIDSQDPRPLTLTGGLPFFGGAGNNYAMHAIAEAYTASLAAPGSVTLVGANGGHLTKHAVGIYSTEPAPLSIAAPIPKAAGPVALEPAPSGEGILETYTYRPSKKDGTRVIGIIRMADGGSRCVANVAPGDLQTLSACTENDPINQAVRVTSSEVGNQFTLIH